MRRMYRQNGLYVHIAAKKWITILNSIRVGNKPNLWLFISHNCSILYREQNHFDIDLFFSRYIQTILRLF